MEQIELLQTIGKNIFRYRKMAGLTQEALCERTGLTTGSISKIERGAMAVKITTLCNIAQALNVTCDALLYSDKLASASVRNIEYLLSDQSDEFVAEVEHMVRYWVTNFTYKPTERKGLEIS